mgnify:FL=1
MWKREMTLEAMNRASRDSMTEHLGIEFTEITDHSLVAPMPVDARTTQPFGVLHGGASAVLAETVGSFASYLCTEGDERPAGLELNLSHLRAVSCGKMTAIAKPYRIGSGHQVWEVTLYNDKEQLCCAARLTLTILK